MKILEWVLAVLLALVMLGAGANKLLSSEFRTDLADQINVPGWFLILVGLWELALVVDLVWPRFRILGGIGVVVTMIGAAISHVVAAAGGQADQVPSIVSNVVIGLVGLVVAWLAAGRPSSPGAMLARARTQAMGQLDAVTDATSDMVS